MLRTLLGILLLVVVLVAASAFFFGYRWRSNDEVVSNQPAATVASGDVINRDRARETGAKIADKVAEGANRAEEVLAQASLTAKVKSKMTLDDTLNGTRINVDTNGTQITLTGVVVTDAQRQRALQLARETEGVTVVVDRLAVERR